MSDLIILFLLVLLNAVFVMCEMALVSAKKNRLEVRANRGDKKSKIALDLKENPDVFLSTTQVFITLISILTGVFSGQQFEGYLEPYISRISLFKAYSATISTVIIVILVTFLSILFGELVPKRIAIMRPEYIARRVARPIKLLSRISFPAVWLLSTINAGIFTFLRIRPRPESQVTEEEIKALINEGSELGAIEEEEKDIIERVFHLGDRNITSMMTHRTEIVWFELGESKESVIRKIRDSHHSVYPLCNQTVDDIQGVVYVKDMYLKPEANLKSLCRKTLFVPENNSAYQVLEKIKTTKIPQAFIIDEYGSLLGLITAKDVLGAILGELPEAEDKPYEILERKDGSYLVDGQIRFFDFLAYFDKTIWIDEGEYEFDTLAGFILHELKRIPATGDSFEWKSFQFEIIDMDGQRIDKVLVHISEEIRDEMD
ncbi:MAG: HlyC/CorC family transporter [Bacteroidota bacterium]|nr:HlyC/CorC family transporter [Bacteroidota bacterium]